MIKALIFNFGQTLVDSADGFRTAEKEAKSLIFAELGSAPDGPSWDAFLPCYRRLRKEYHQRSNFSRPAIWQAVYAYFNRQPDLKKLEKWENNYWDQVKARTKPFPETIKILKELADSYQLALITNTQGQKAGADHRITLFPQLERFFKVIIVAGECGVPSKPDPEPFRLCLQQLKVLAREAVFVGDDWRIDVCGARNAGIRPVWIQHHSVRRNWPDVTDQVPIIAGLDQLLDLASLSL